MPFYAICTRQSRVRHDITLSSCDVQFQICRDFADAVLPQGSVWCGTRYDDPGQSGETLDRPALQALLNAVEAGVLSQVVVYRLDRLSRRLRDTVRILDTFRRHGVELRVVTAQDLGDSATGQLMLNMLASFAEFEHSLISERIRESVCARRRGGRRLSGKPPFGYDLDKDTGGLVVNATEARKARAFFRLAAAGQTPRQIAEYANRRGWTTKVYTAHSTGKRLGGSPWAARQVLELLRNPVYAGCLRDGAGGLRPGHHRAIVDAGLFPDVQSILDARRSSAGERQSVDVPLKGKVFCGECGRVMSPHVVHSRQKPHIHYVHYRCRSQAGGRPPCKGISVPAEQLRVFILDVMRDEDELAQDADLSPEARQALRSAVWLIDGFRVPDPYMAIGDIIERIVFNRDSIRVVFSDPGLQDLLNGPPCEPRYPLTGGSATPRAEPGR